MALAAPDYFAGALDPLRGAAQLFAAAGWVRRRCNEILAEPLLDPVKLYGLAAHCLAFRQEADKWIVADGDLVAVREELVRLTRTAGVGNASKAAADINEDYKQLYAEAEVFLAWAAASLPAAGQPLANAVVTVNRAWPNPDFIVRVPKPAAITTRVQALRDVFA